METPIFDFVSRYADSGISRLHMPGHKGIGPLGCEALDITEICGADSLYEAEGVIAASERNASTLFGTCRTFYSAGGSSQCIKAMLELALRGSKSRTILAARNVHKAFVHAAALLDFDVAWLWPEEYQLLQCPITPQALAAALETMEPLPAAVYLTSPDYLGHVQPVGALSAVCRRYGVPLLVDNAHGAYLHFLPVPSHPMDLGADLCCDSAHKTLPVLTGGAYLHLSSLEPFGGESCVRQSLGLFGSTSPSYLILQSLDLCNAYLSDAFREQLENTVREVDQLKADLLGQGWPVEESEPLKVVVKSPSSQLPGTALADHLRLQGVECEYADREYVVLMFSPMNTQTDYSRVRNAFPPCQTVEPLPRLSLSVPSKVMGIRQALFSPCEEVPVAQAVGRICGTPTVSCPPAVPIVVSGERIGPDAAAVFAQYQIHSISVVKE